MGDMRTWFFAGATLFGQVMRLAGPALWSSSEFG